MKEVLQKKCGNLSDPMGKPDTVQMSQDVPVVHPIIIYRWNHFKRSTAFTDGTYQIREVQREAAYNREGIIQFNDVVGLVGKN